MILFGARYQVSSLVYLGACYTLWYKDHSSTSGLTLLKFFDAFVILEKYF